MMPRICTGNSGSQLSLKKVALGTDSRSFLLKSVIDLTKSMRIIMVEQVVPTVEENVCIILVREAKRRRLFGKHRYEGERNIQN